MLADSRANERVGNRLLGAGGSIYEAFDRLGCGIAHDEAVEYLKGSPELQALDLRQQARIVGVALAFAMVAVESEREIRNYGRWRFGRSVPVRREAQ